MEIKKEHRYLYEFDPRDPPPTKHDLDCFLRKTQKLGYYKKCANLSVKENDRGSPSISCSQKCIVHDDDGQGGATRERACGAEREQWHLEPRRVALDAKVILTPPSIFYC